MGVGVTQLVSNETGGTDFQPGIHMLTFRVLINFELVCQFVGGGCWGVFYEDRIPEFSAISSKMSIT